MGLLLKWTGWRGEGRKGREGKASRIKHYSSSIKHIFYREFTEM